MHRNKGNFHRCSRLAKRVEETLDNLVELRVALSQISDLADGMDDGGMMLTTEGLTDVG